MRMNSIYLEEELHKGLLSAHSEAYHQEEICQGLHHAIFRICRQNIAMKFVEGMAILLIIII